MSIDVSRALRSRRSGTALLAATILLAVGCSGSDGDGSADGSTASTDTAPVTTAFDDSEGTPDDTMPEGDFDLEIDDEVIIATEDGEVPTTTTEPPAAETPDAPPTTVADTVATTAPAVPLPAAEEVDRIVSLEPTHTETLFALGLGELVVGVDPSSDFPAEAVGLQREELRPDVAEVDPILALDPDVVLLGDDPTGMADRLAAAGVATYVGPTPADLEGAFAQIGDVAGIVGRPDLAEDLVSDLRGQIDDVTASLPPAGADGGRGTFFHEIDPSLFTIGDDSFVSNVYETLGLTNIASGTGVTPTQLAAADVLDADPDVIVLADAECCDVTIDRVAARPGWSDLSAVSTGAVVTVDEALVERWGPRVVDLLRAVAGGVAAAG